MSQVPLTDEEREKCESMSIEKLRKYLKDSNKSRTFEKSRQINEIIHKRLHSDVEGALKPIMESLDGDIKKAFAEYKAACDEYAEEFKQREQYLRLGIDDTFGEMVERHIADLKELEIQCGLEALREERRTPAIVKLLTKISIHLADREEYDQAISIDREATEAGEKEAAERANAIKLKYSKLRKTMADRFEKEIRLLEERLEKGLAAVDDQYAGEIKIQQKQCSCAVQRLLLAAINKATSQVRKKDKQAEITTRLTDFVRKRVAEFGMNRKLLFDE